MKNKTTVRGIVALVAVVFLVAAGVYGSIPHPSATMQIIAIVVFGVPVVLGYFAALVVCGLKGKYILMVLAWVGILMGGIWSLAARRAV